MASRAFRGPFEQPVHEARLRAVARVATTRPARVAAFVGAAAAVAGAFAWMFHPLFLSFDSYHYMVLSYRPEVGNAHPLGFGWLLRLLRAVSERFHLSYSYVFQLWQTLCLTGLVFAIHRRDANITTAESAGRAPRKQWSLRAAGLGLFVLFVALLAPALVLLMNGFWTEMTSFLVIALAAIAFDRALRTGRRSAWAAFVLLCVAGFHVRYQLVMLAVASTLVTVALVYVQRAFPTQRMRHALVALLASAALVWGSQRVLAAWLPETGMAQQNTGVFLQKSIQCRLRCAVNLFAVDCSTPAGKKIIEQATCADLIADRVEFGVPVVDPSRIKETLSHVGPSGVAKWLVLAPLTYLRESYFVIDIEHYGFDRNIRILSRHPEALEPYARLLPRVGAKPSPAFEAIVAWLSLLYFELRAFHVLVGLMLSTSALVLWRSRSAAATFLALMCLLTYFVFSTVQPKAPLHYLVQIAMPGFLATVIALRHREKHGS